MDTGKLSPEHPQGGTEWHNPTFSWARIRNWMVANTLTPTWLPPVLQSPFAGYLAAAALQIIASAAVALLLTFYPGFTFADAPSLLIVLVIALNWGGTLGIFATLFGCLPIIFFLLPPTFSLQISEPGDVLGIFFYIIIGVTISLLVSRMQRARIEADRQRQRFQDVFMQAPTPIIVLRGPEQRVAMLNPAARNHTIGDEATGKTLVEVLSGHDLQNVLQRLDDVYKTGKSFFVKERRVPGNETRSEQYFDFTYQPTRDYKGELNGVILFSVDVTDQVQARKRAETAEQQANERAQEMEAIFEAIADPLFIVDEQSGPRRVNRAARELIGISNTIATGQLRERGPFFELYDEWDHVLSKEVWPQTRILAGEVLRGATAVDVIMHTQDGRKLYLSITGAPVFAADGSIQSAVLASRDVTARRQAERERERLLASEQTILNVIPVGLSIVDVHGRLLRWNAFFEQIWGKSALMVESKDDYAAYKAWWTSSGKELAPEDWGVSRALASGEVSSNEEIDIESFDGQRKTVLLAAAPFYDQSGQLLGGVTAMLDVTERKQLERRTQAALEALLSMAQVIVQGPTELKADDPTATPDSLPQRPVAQSIAQRLIELVREVLVCKQIAVAMIEPGTGRMTPLAIAGLSRETEERWRQEISSSYASDYLDEQSIKHLLTDEVMVLDLEQKPPFARDYHGFGFSLAVPLLKENIIFGAMILDYGSQTHNYTQQEIALARAVARLITLVVEREHLLTERAEARANEIALREANRLKDEFIGIAGHELRTPLTTIKATVQLAQRQLKRVMLQNEQLPDDVTKSIATVQGFLNRTERQIGMQNRLVNDLLDVSRVETGRLELHPALCNLLPLVSEVVEDQHYLTPDRTLTLHLPAASELLVMADADRVRQVVSNYLSNALKYSEADKPVAIDIETNGSRVRVAVRDEGPGLSESQQQHVWERFYRVPGVEVKTGSGVGLGLGLHISRMIIERQGGRVGLQSVPGKGSTFWFTLPLAE